MELQLISIILENSAPIISSFISGVLGYLVARNKSASSYRDTELQFIKKGQLQLIELHQKQIISLEDLFNDERERLKEEIKNLSNKVEKLESGLNDLSEELYKQKKEHLDELSKLYSANRADRALVDELKNEVAMYLAEIEKLKKENKNLLQIVNKEKDDKAILTLDEINTRET